MPLVFLKLAMSGNILLRPSTSLRNNPYEILDQIQSKVKASRIELPKSNWQAAVAAVPPAPISLSRPDSGLFGTKKSFKPFNPEFKRINNPKKTYKPRYVVKPPKIVYEEDKIRKEFFKMHPFELSEPLVVKETESSLNSARFKRKVDGIQSFMIDDRVTGERLGLRYNR